MARGRGGRVLIGRSRPYSSIGVYACPEIGDARLRAAVEARLPEGLGVGITQSRTIRAESMRLFDGTFAITRVLRLLAAVIAFAGVFFALMALELDRTREAGLLRALGMTQAGLSGLLLVETGLTGLIGRPPLGVLRDGTPVALAAGEVVIDAVHLGEPARRTPLPGPHPVASPEGRPGAGGHAPAPRPGAGCLGPLLGGGRRGRGTTRGVPVTGRGYGAHRLCRWIAGRIDADS